MATKKAATPAQQIAELHKQLTKEGNDFVRRTDALIADLDRDLEKLDHDATAATKELADLSQQQTDEFDEALADLLLHAQD